MGFLGVGLGLLVACLWGLADIFAILAARRLSTFKATFLSQLVSLLGLIAIGVGAFFFSHLFFTLPALVNSASIGIFTGMCAALAFLSLYRALELGPVAITGPLTATSPIFTLILSASILREHLTLAQIGFVVLGILGIVLASMNLPELHILLTKFRFSFWTPGVRWAMVATLTFGTLDFGVGAAVAVSNWFLPGLFTRFFTLLFLALFAYAIRIWRRLRIQMALVPASQKTPGSLSFPSFEEMNSLWKPSQALGRGVSFALIVGAAESAAILVFSLGTQVATTSVTSAIASSYGLFVMLFGVLVYRERLGINQFLGIGLFMTSLIFLAL